MAGRIREGVTASPLSWPAGWKRRTHRQRARAMEGSMDSVGPGGHITVTATEDGRIAIAGKDWHRWNAAQQRIGEARATSAMLRDQIAMAALTGLLANPHAWEERTREEIVAEAEWYADALLAARERK